MQINRIKAERILSPTGITLADFVINPYRGCGYACVYCYVRQNKSILKRKQAWGSFVDIKVNAVDLLQQELAGKAIKRLLIGSTTDPYQDEEQNCKTTRSILEILANRNIPVTILTRSLLVLRDIDILQKNSNNIVYVTINLMPQEIAKTLEPKTVMFAKRLDVLKQLKQADIKTVAYVSPYLPGVSDIETIFKKIEYLTDTLFIELYNIKMGNWASVGKTLEKFSRKEFLNIQECFKCKEAYKDLAKKEEDKFKNINQKYGFKMKFFVPEYDFYYSNKY